MRALIALALAAAVTTAGRAEACPDYRGQPTYGQIDLAQNFQPDPYRRDVVAGGPFSLTACGFSDIGWVAADPDFDLYYTTTGGYDLTIAVESTVDTILLVNGPDGTWYYDDDNGIGAGAKVTISNPTSGLYDIWIGTYDINSNTNGVLVITELD